MVSKARRWKMTAVEYCLVSVLHENDLKIMNTHPGHKRIHAFIWSCPGRGLQFIIDYVLVRNDQKRYVHDVRVIRGVEIESDHYIVLANVNIFKRILKKNEVRRSQLRSLPTLYRDH